MLEKIKEDDAVPEFVQASKLVIPEYLELLENLSLYGKLFSLKYRVRETDLGEFQRVLGLSDASLLVGMERKLDAYLRVVMGGEVRLDKVDLVCPECLKLNIVRYDCRGEEIKPCCSECGTEIDDSFADCEDFDQSLSRDVTYASTSHLSYTGGLGGSFDPNRNRDQNNFLWQMLNAGNVLFSDFAKEFPEVALELESNYVVLFKDYAFCRIDNFVRKVPVDQFFEHLNSLFHAFDVPLKNKKIRLEIAPKSHLKTALSYGLKLCQSYGFDMTSRDQALLNTVGHEIALMKSLVKSQPALRIPERRLVETVFYICLLKFGKRSAAGRAKRELSVDLPLVNFYFDYADFRKVHERLSFSGVRLDALEQLVSKEP